MWIPRRYHQQTAAALHEVLLAAATTLAQGTWSTSAECTQRLLFHLPQLLLRIPRDQPPATAEHSDDVPSFTTALKARLQLFRSKDFGALLDAYVADIAPAARPPVHPPRQSAQGVDPRKAQAAAIRARTGALRSAADILTGGPPVPPTPEIRALIAEQFITSAPDPANLARLHAATAAARNLPAKRKCEPRLKHLANQLARSKAAAGPGPSGWRNSHIACLYSHQAGPHALLAWATAWAQGDIPAWAAAIWAAALARPFWKTPEQRTIRPIMCTEALLKFAFGIVASSAKAQIEIAAGPHQYGVGCPAGAEREVAELRAATALRPHSTFVALDVKNAFGSVHWHQALEVLLATVPKLAPPLAALWQNGRTQVYTATEDGSWAPFDITGSLVQGNVEAHIVFCLIMTQVMHLAYHNPDVTPQARAAWWYWVYVDDCVLQADAPHLTAIFQSVHAALAGFNLRLQPPKCVVHHPNSPAPPPPLLPFLASTWGEAGSLTYDGEGLTVLGTDACSGRATPLSPTGQDAARHLAKRAQRAIDLAQAVRSMIQFLPPAGALQPAWAIITSIVCHSTTYDARVMPCRLVLPYAQLVESAALQTIDAILGTSGTLSPQQLLQLALPTRHAGLDVHFPTHICPLAYAASLIEHGPSLRAAIRSRVADADVAEHDGVDAALLDGLPRLLADRHIFSLGPGGVPSSLPTDLAPSEQFRPHVPLRHLLSLFRAHSAATAHSRLLADAAIPDAIRLRSAAGATAGTCITAHLRHGGPQFTDAAFRTMLRWRLGLPTTTAACCCNWNNSRAEPCGHPLTPDHAVICPCGPSRNLRHRGLIEAWSDIFEEAGGTVRQEVYAPCFSTPLTEAYLDLTVTGLPELEGLYFDVTVRHPRDTHYSPNLCATQDGVALLRAAAEKQHRYPPSNTGRVITLAAETWGRTSGDCDHILAICAASATRQDHRRGRLPPPSRLHRWRASLDAALQHAIASQLLLASTGPHGHARTHRRRPVDLTVLEVTPPPGPFTLPAGVTTAARGP